MVHSPTTTATTTTTSTTATTSAAASGTWPTGMSTTSHAGHVAARIVVATQPAVPPLALGPSWRSIIATPSSSTSAMGGSCGTVHTTIARALVGPESPHRNSRLRRFDSWLRA